MTPQAFMTNKLKNLLSTRGKPYTFTRYALDEYSQRTDTAVSTVELTGVFHETKGYVNKTVAEGSTTFSKAQPMIMTSFETAKLIEFEDLVVCGENTYKVVEIGDVNALGIIADISLEVTNEVQV